MKIKMITTLSHHLRSMVFVDSCDFVEDQVTFHDQFLQKSRKMHLLFLAAACACWPASTVISCGSH